MDPRTATAVKPALETTRKEPRIMMADHLQGIEKFEADLWKIADNLRANSNLASNEYFMPIMGLIFLRHATNRFYEAKAAIEADQAAGKMPRRGLGITATTYSVPVVPWRFLSRGCARRRRLSGMSRTISV